VGRYRPRGPSRWTAPAVLLTAVLGLALADGGSALGEPDVEHLADELGPTQAEGDHDAHAHGHAAGAMGAHEQDEGFELVAQTGESVDPGGRCPDDAPVRSYDVVAIAVEITLNRYLDHDPDGRMYVLEASLEAVREEEAANKRARTAGSDPAVSRGLQGDAIQPLTLRVLPGECLRVRLRNDLPGEEAATFHVHGSQLVVAESGRPAIATEPSAVTRPGEHVTYEWAVPADEPEGTHHVHSHGDTRRQTSHGLFGAVVVEPPGASWRDGSMGDQVTASWSAIVVPEDGPAFREFVVYYHEIGTESEVPLGADGTMLPLVDPITSSYKPSGRALNYRSEPFMHRLQLQVDEGETPDESIAYSSYAFGDPATPIMRSYVGEPVKQRVVHGGSEVFHVHHVHGGSIRWPRQPGVAQTPTITELEKHPPLVPNGSERTDSESMGPSETFDVEPECGAGGCQQSVGDVLFHCHVAHHYISGMWGIWRVYNTLQDGSASTDQLPPLRELPDRAEEVSPAVTSDLLSPEMQEGIEGQLPPRGAPAGGDASVWDWSKDGDRYLGEPEDPRSWPGHTSRTTGRPPLLFDPRDGRLAYPHLRPHLARRPPFAPGHGPAPYLDPGGGSPDAPKPGENGDRSVCPRGARVRDLDIVAVDVPIPLNIQENLVDPAGMLFVRREERDRVLADPTERTPLVLRANASVDCVDLTLTSEVADDADNEWLSKVNAHIHFVQFDVQGSDGVDAGFNYEQSVRPWTVESEPITGSVDAGATRLPVARTDRYQEGALVMVGVDTADRSEVRTVEAVEDGVLLLAEPLEHHHATGERVTVEFVRYRWYPDVQFGTAFFHDHVNAIFSGQHGLWGALVAEPPDATWHHPETGEELLSGTVADVHTTRPVSIDVSGSFRELVAFVQDDNPVTKRGRSSGSSLGLRVEPLDARVEDDPATAFDSTRHGDPETPMVRAFAGDPVVLRTLVSATNDVHTLHIDGHGFRVELWSDTSPPVTTAHLGISERLDLVIPSAGGPARLPGDYLLRNGRMSKLREGSWGLLRVLTPGDPEGVPRPLPGTAPDPPGDRICPPDAPVKPFDITAIEAPLPMLDGDHGLFFVPTDAAETAVSDAGRDGPLVLRVRVGDCLQVTVRNAASRGVSFEPDLIVFDPGERAVGRNGGAPVPPEGRRTSRFFAHPSFGEATVLVLDGGDPLGGPPRGGYAAVAVAESGAMFQDPESGEEVATGWRVDVIPPEAPAYRDAVVFLQEEDPAIGTHLMPYRDAVEGAVGINYRLGPLGDRLLDDPDPARVFDSIVHGDPPTPLIDTYAGDPLRLRVLAPIGEQGQVFSVEGHRWRREQRPGGTLLSSMKLGALEAVTIDLEGGAGGPARLPGDYLYGDHREPYREAGLWGLLRVRDPCAAEGGLRPLPATRATCAGGLQGVMLAAAAMVGILVVGFGMLRLRRRRDPDGTA
jgi:manganese oxidase